MSLEKFITDEQAEAALDWLRDNAQALGNAKRDLVIHERMVGRIMALEMKRNSELSLGAQEREAKISDAMLVAWDAEATAAGEYEKLRALRDAAIARVEAWRSLTANFRAMSK